MNAPFHPPRSNMSENAPSRDRSRRARASRTPWAAVGLGCTALGFAAAGVAGCGAPAEDGNGNGEIPQFGNGQGSSGSTGNPGVSGAPNGSAGSSSTTCVPGSLNCGNGSETINPNAPIDQTQTSPIAMPCTANSVSCQGAVLNRCDATGTQVTPQNCAATTGGTCGQVGGVASCIAPTSACTPGAVTCEGANTISTCAADGSSPTITRCPDGTNCTGNGQCTPVTCNPTGMLSSNNGSATVYWFNQGTYSNPRQPDEDINCSFGSDGSQTGQGEQDRVNNIEDGALFGAINGNQYSDAAACGACVEMSYQGRTVKITVADSCLVDNNNPVCQTGHIDLSRGAWNALTNNAQGTIIRGVSWRFVPCAGSVEFQLKEPTNEYWNEFLVLNHAYPVVKAEVLMEDGRWVEAQRSTYNYWHPSEGANGDGGDMGTYRVRVTDINGGVIEEQLELLAGPQGGSGQFACQ